jgi:hypothetical protein
LICTLSIHGYRFTFKHLCWHSITKILRNGPREHFPFSHSATECREIIELTKRVSERCGQTSKDSSPPRRWSGKERVDSSEVAARYQSPEGVLKHVFTGDSESGDDN